MLALSIFLEVITTEEEQKKFTLIYAKYKKPFLSIAFSILGDTGDAEDATQDAFFSLARNIKKLNIDNEQMLDFYVKKTIKNASLNIAKKKQRQPKLIFIGDCSDLPCNEDLAENLEKKEQYEKIVRIIKEMPERYRDVLSYMYIGEFSVSEIADFMNLNEHTVRTYLRRGKRYINERIDEND